MLRISDEELLKRYKIFVDLQKAGMPNNLYFQKNKIPKKTAELVLRGFVFKRYNDPVMHLRYLKVALYAYDKNIILQEMARKAKISYPILMGATTYINYNYQIKKILKEKGLPFEYLEDLDKIKIPDQLEDESIPIKFFHIDTNKKIDPQTTSMPKNENAIKAQTPANTLLNIKSYADVPASLPVSETTDKNEIEFTIKKGVRIFVSSDICSSKIIKIIDLLKDL